MKKANNREKVGEKGEKEMEINFDEKTYSGCGKLKKSNGNIFHNVSMCEENVVECAGYSMRPLSNGLAIDSVMVCMKSRNT